MNPQTTTLREPGTLTEAIARGVRNKRCPHCGQGDLFISWNRLHHHCPVCGFLYEKDYGDSWWLWIVIDRIPLFIAIVFVYFGFRVTNWATGAVFFSALTLPLLVTIPHRHGLGIAISYWMRRCCPDPDDELPTLSSASAR